MRLKSHIAVLCVSLATISLVQAAQPSSKSPTPPSKRETPALASMLHQYLLDQAHQYFEARRSAISAIKTPEDIARRQQALRAFLLRSLGDMPQRSPLNAHVVGTLNRAGFRVEKVIFESRPNHHVTANFYVPEGKPPFPGVLVPCGHSDNGKAYVEYQRACILLAKNGMAALCYDPIGQGERYQLLDDKGKPVVRGTTEHTMAGIGALLVGRQLASYRVWDGFRALDYLAGRPEVDPGRLGCTGNSGGGTMTSYLMALDDRIAVAAPSCFITSLERLFATIGPQDAEQNIRGQVAALMDHADYLTIRAPKPTLLTVGTRDFFDINGSWDTFREAKLIYGRLGFGERVDLFESDEPHGFTRPRRIATVRWMRRWLLNEDDGAVEPEFPVATDAELQCTRTGQVLTDFHDASVFDLNASRERELRVAQSAATGERSTDEFRADVKKRLGLGQQSVTRVPSVANQTGRSLTIYPEPGIRLMATLVQGNRKPGHKGPIRVEVGADGEARSGVGSDERADTHTPVVRIDLRGMGVSAPPIDQGRAEASPFGRDWKEAFLALYLDRPLLGQRAIDLLSVLGALDAEWGGNERAGFDVVGTGAAGPIVLHAALLDDRGLIKSVTLERSLVSWASILQTKISRGQLGNVVPGALESYDLPDLAARLAPRRLTIHGAVDALGNPVSQSTLEETYLRCAKAYGPGGQLELRADHGLTPSR
jgi:dienelactone hydrolase